MKCSSHWVESLPVPESLDVLRDLAYDFACEAGPYAETLKALIHKGQFRELCSFEVDYSLDGLSPHAVKHARQAVALFSKLRQLDIGVDRESVGLSKFFEAEQLCKESNDRLTQRRAGTLGFPARVDAVFLAAQRKIRRVLGDVPSLDQVTLRFGPGATRRTKKKDASTRAKCSEGVTCSEELVPLLPAMLRELPHFSSENACLSWVDEDGDEWDRIEAEVVTSMLSFAFKNALSYRLIGIEALLNLMYQLGYGIEIAKRLASFGVDIRDQTRNQRLAREGSLTGALATLDLSSASDTVSNEIVYELLPLDWAHVLARGRSEKIELPDGSIIRQEKFSAMGNGYTFPLETLIFWALASCACPKGSVVSVYGDDIIVPSECFDFVVEVLRYAGFNANLKKSFKTTPFRESCGHDYFEGIDVRPYFQKEWVSGQSLFSMHNFFVRKGEYAIAKKVENYIHPALRIYGPDNFGDGHLIGDHDRRLTASQLRAGYGGYFFETFSTRQRKEQDASLRGTHPAALYSIYMRGEKSPGLPVKGDNSDDTSSWYSALLKRTVPALADRIVSSGTPISESSGKKTWPLPGVDGYKKLKIYTLGG
jgi:hypothetical protein